METEPEQKVSESATRHLSGPITATGSAGLRKYFGARPKHSLPHFYFLPFLLNTKGKEGKKVRRLRLGLGLMGSSLPKNGNNRPACGTLLLENFTLFPFFSPSEPVLSQIMSSVGSYWKGMCSGMPDCRGGGGETHSLSSAQVYIRSALRPDCLSALSQTPFILNESFLFFSITLQ